MFGDIGDTFAVDIDGAAVPERGKVLGSRP
jgi:hypothetical protein